MPSRRNLLQEQVAHGGWGWTSFAYPSPKLHSPSSSAWVNLTKKMSIVAGAALWTSCEAITRTFLYSSSATLEVKIFAMSFYEQRKVQQRTSSEGPPR